MNDSPLGASEIEIEFTIEHIEPRLCSTEEGENLIDCVKQPIDPLWRSVVPYPKGLHA